MANYTSQALFDLLEQALLAKGFTPHAASALARQTVLAEEMGQQSVGVAHVFDYTGGVDDGRIDPQAAPVVTRPARTIIHVNGQGGLPQTGFDLAFDQIVAETRSSGSCVFLSANAMLCGPLGTFVLRLAEAGFVAFAATNGSPLLAGSGSSEAVYCTNPIAFAAPRDGNFPLLIDQSCSATAFVNIRAAADAGEEIPLGWAIDKDGNPTNDPKAALEGSLLPFGGERGANLALMVEVMAGGLPDANFSIDAAPFHMGSVCPATGLFVLAIDPTAVNKSFGAKMADYLDRMATKYGVYIPGLSKAKKQAAARERGIDVSDDLIERLKAMTGD